MRLERLPANVSTLDIRLSHGATLSGYVRAGGKPVSGALVGFADTDLTTHTRGDGSCELGWLSAGEVELYVQPSETSVRFREQRRRVTLLRDGAATLDFDVLLTTP